MRRATSAAEITRTDAKVPADQTTGSKRRPLRWFVAMPARMALDPGLSSNAFRLASLLLHYEGDRGCFPSQGRLAEDLGTSLDSVQRYLRELELYGFLAREKRRGFPNRYVLAPVYEPPIRHGSLEETGDLEVENRPKRRPPAPRALRVPKARSEASVPGGVPVGSIDDRRASRDAARTEVAAPVRLRDEPVLDEVTAPVRPLQPVEATEPAAPVRHEATATGPEHQPHRCGTNKIPSYQELNQQHRAGPREPGGGDVSREKKENETGLAALQRSGVNIAERDLGIHHGRDRRLSDDELGAWAEWVISTPAPGIVNKAAFAAVKVRTGTALSDVFPARASDARRREEAEAAKDAAAERDRVDEERAARADELISCLPPAEREKLRGHALDDGAVWLARGSSRALLARMILAAERRLVLNEVQPCAVARDHSEYPE